MELKIIYNKKDAKFEISSSYYPELFCRHNNMDKAVKMFNKLISVSFIYLFK